MQYVTWAELIYIQLLTPNASFLGHLAGILAGILHVSILQYLPFLSTRTIPFSGMTPGILAGILHVCILQYLPFLSTRTIPFSGTGWHPACQYPAVPSLPVSHDHPCLRYDTRHLARQHPAVPSFPVNQDHPFLRYDTRHLARQRPAVPSFPVNQDHPFLRYWLAPCMLASCNTFPSCQPGPSLSHI